MHNESAGFFYLSIAHLPPLIASTLLMLTRERIDPAARFAAHRRSIQTLVIYRPRLETLAHSLTPRPTTRILFPSRGRRGAGCERSPAPPSPAAGRFSHAPAALPARVSHYPPALLRQTCSMPNLPVIIPPNPPPPKPEPRQLTQVELEQLRLLNEWKERNNPK